MTKNSVSLSLPLYKPGIRLLREDVRGVAGVATAKPILQILFHKIVVLKWPKIPKVQTPQNYNIPKARITKGSKAPNAKGPKAQNPEGPKVQRAESPKARKPKGPKAQSSKRPKF